MQKQLIFSSLILIVCVGPLQHVQALEPHPVEEHRRKIDPTVIRYCVNQLLYDVTSVSGKPVGDRTIIDPASAAFACQGVQSKQESFEIKKCVNGLLYETIFFNGKPAGDRTVLDPASAARACSHCESH